MSAVQNFPFQYPAKLLNRVNFVAHTIPDIRPMRLHVIHIISAALHKSPLWTMEISIPSFLPTGIPSKRGRSVSPTPSMMYWF